MTTEWPGWLLWVVPASGLALLCVWHFADKSRNKRPDRSTATMDLGGIALQQVLAKLNTALDNTADHNDAALDSIVLMVRSALTAYLDSCHWHTSEGLVIEDASMGQALIEATLDAMKLMTPGSRRWCELKLVLDSFCRHLSANDATKNPWAGTATTLKSS